MAYIIYLVYVLVLLYLFVARHLRLGHEEFAETYNVMGLKHG